MGDRGESLRDLHQRLAACGHDVGVDEPDEFGDSTREAVRAFQEARGIRIDGIVGRETWAALVESGYALGDRLQYVRRPMLRGDDVVELQHRLNALGFDAGRDDGIFGSDTARALMEFQGAAGLPPDGICGASTIGALERVGSFAAGSAASLRERLRAGPPRLTGRRIYVASTPGLAAIGDRVVKLLLDKGAVAVHDASGSDDSAIAAEANQFEADLFLALRVGGEAGHRCAYFASARFRSEVGAAVATEIDASLQAILPARSGVEGKAYAVLRETRMPAVVCEPISGDDVEEMRTLVARAGDVGRAVVVGVRKGIEAVGSDG
ncbi:MAG TPA: peptidoglycan-binding protein [Acidimicrobiia bacterium]|nr:peptidoglycan-binding protein [Acidimicrobiia bacterium]